MTHQPALTQNSPRQRILVVDDEADTRLLLTLRLQHAGYRVEVAGSGGEALAFVQQAGLPQLALLNMLLPDMDGFGLAAALQHLGAVPIIFLSAQADTQTKVEALTRYAEDYVTKPFDFAELLVRIHRVLARVAVASEAVIDEHLRLNFARQYAVVDHIQIRLTPLETRLLQLFSTYRGRVLSPAFLLANAWPPGRPGTIPSLWAHIRSLRRKLEPDPAQPRYLITVQEQGYLLPTLIPPSHDVLEEA